jgi:restriction system protein
MEGNNMAIPKFFDFFPVILKVLRNGEIMPVKDIRAATADLMSIAPEDREVLLPSGKQRVVDNRANWAITYLRKAKLLESPSEGKCKITEEGKRALLDASAIIDLNYLERYESFRAFRYPIAQNDNVTITEKASIISESTPQDAMDNAFKQINDELANALLQSILARSPRFFEKLVVELLLKMGYGGAFDDAGITIGQSGDEGIDGIIREDKLGFSSIYIQAKRWSLETSIGRPEIQKFVGALAGQGAQKGLFITTAQFTKESRNYIGKQSATKVVLVDGENLAKLMIEYDIGVSTQTIYAIKKIDSDFFSEEND